MKLRPIFWYVSLALLLFLPLVLGLAGDFRVYYDGARGFLAGGWAGVYHKESLTPFKYHPFNVFLFLPVGALPWGLAKALWAALNSAVFVFAVDYFVKTKALPPKRVPALLLLVLHGLTWELKLANVTILMLGLLVVAAEARRDLPAALAVSLLILLKPFWLVLLPALVLAGRARLLIPVVGILVLASVFPLLGGMESGLSAFSLWKGTLSDPVHAHNYPKLDNQSLFGLLWRFFGDDPARVFPIWVIGSLAAGLAYLFVVLKGPRENRGKTALYATVPVVLWIGPLSWIHHEILLLPLLAELLSGAVSYPLIALVWLTLDGSGRLFWGKRIAGELGRMGVPLLGYALTLFGISWRAALGKSRRSDRDPSAPCARAGAHPPPARA